MSSIQHRQKGGSTGGGGGGGGAVTPEEILAAYNQFSSSASIFVPQPTQVKLQTAPTPIGPNNYRFSAMTQATQGGVTRGVGFVIDPTSKFIVATRDMYAVDVSFFCTARWTEGDPLCMGVGVGDPAQMPQYPGQDVVGKAYISRFHEEQVGKMNRVTTMNVTQKPVGRSTYNGSGIRQGDKIFPVMWRPEGNQGAVSIYELIMSVTEIPYST